MPLHMHTPRTAHYYSVPRSSLSQQRASTLFRRGGSGDPTAVFVVVACIVVGIVLILLLMGWAHKSHKKQNAKRRANHPSSGWKRPVSGANTRPNRGGSRSGRSQGAPFDEESATGGYAENDGGYAENNGGYVQNNGGYDTHTLGPSALPSAYVRGNAPPPPPFQSVRDITFPSSFRGHGGSNNGRSYRAPSIADYMSGRGSVRPSRQGPAAGHSRQASVHPSLRSRGGHSQQASSHPRQLGAPSADQYYEER